MKQKAVIEVRTYTPAEEQFILKRFPGAIWIACGKSVRFYIQYQEFNEVKKVIEEWENKNE